MSDQVLHLSDDEVHELSLLMQREMASASVGLHHSRTRGYREVIHQRMAVISSILAKLEAAERAATTAEVG